MHRDEDISLSSGQQLQFVNELTGCHGVAAIQGDAGTGKTFVSSIVERFNKEVLAPNSRGHYTINVAFTGKAALEMEGASGSPSYTIDAFLNAYHNGKVIFPNQDSSHPAFNADELHIPAGQQVAIKIDEFSFVGARQAEQLLNIVREFQSRGIQTKILFIGDTKQLQAITSGDLFRQVQKLAKTGNADYAHLKEIIRQKDMGLRRIAINLNREDQLLSDNAHEAIDALCQRNAVIEIPDRETLIQVAAERYITASNTLSHDPAKAISGIKSSTLLAVATNADRKELNRTIRGIRINNGEIEPGRSYEILTSAQQPPVADGYRIGQHILFSGYRGTDGKMRAWGARLMQEGRITGINNGKNTVTIQYAYAKNGIPRTVRKELPADQLALYTAIYNQEERQFSAGDRIVFLKNDNRLGVKNGSFGIIDTIDTNGNTKVTLDGGKQFSFNLAHYTNIDHAYAITIHKAQGATVEHCMMFSYVKPDLDHISTNETAYGHASYNGLNVAVTRAQYCAELITNSISGLKKAVSSIDSKTSTLDFPNQQTKPEIKNQSDLTTKINRMSCKKVQATVPNTQHGLAGKIKALTAKLRNRKKPQAPQKENSEKFRKQSLAERELE